MHFDPHPRDAWRRRTRERQMRVRVIKPCFYAERVIEIDLPDLAFSQARLREGERN